MLGPFCRSDNPVGRVRRFMRRNPTGQKHLKNKLPDYAVLTPTRPISLKIKSLKGFRKALPFFGPVSIRQGIFLDQLLDEPVGIFGNPLLGLIIGINQPEPFGITFSPFEIIQ